MCDSEDISKEVCIRRLCPPLIRLTGSDGDDCKKVVELQGVSPWSWRWPLSPGSAPFASLLFPGHWEGERHSLPLPHPPSRALPPCHGPKSGGNTHVWPETNPKCTRPLSCCSQVCVTAETTDPLLWHPLPGAHRQGLSPGSGPQELFRSVLICRLCKRSL